ncbi:MAG: hypothetical protein KDN18_10515 [Verrucomicrobiae bacterium]|nr:hypothetical protein [Verrucomicrobiae bacterium]
MCAPAETNPGGTVKVPLPANFGEWPACMQRRFLEQARQRQKSRWIRIPS